MNTGPPDIVSLLLMGCRAFVYSDTGEKEGRPRPPPDVMDLGEEGEGSSGPVAPPKVLERVCEPSARPEGLRGKATGAQGHIP